MTWNIWHGGTHVELKRSSDTLYSMTENIVKVLKHNESDILFMQETYCCGMDIAKRAGYDYSTRGSSNLSIHSKYPIIESINVFKNFNSHAAVIDVNGQKIMCVNVWLHYLPNYFQDIKTKSPDSLILGEGTTRLKEITSILNEIDSLKKTYNMPILIGGDFNSGSHLDWVESTKKFHFNKIVEWPVSKAMIDNGFNDSFRACNPDPTKTLDGTCGYLPNINSKPDRIDYIYFKGQQLKAKSSRIIKDDPPNGFFNSDHRAVLSVFDLLK